MSYQYPLEVAESRKTPTDVGCPMEEIAVSTEAGNPAIIE